MMTDDVTWTNFDAYLETNFDLIESSIKLKHAIEDLTSSQYVYFLLAIDNTSEHGELKGQITNLREFARKISYDTILASEPNFRDNLVSMVDLYQKVKKKLESDVGGDIYTNSSKWKWKELHEAYHKEMRADATDEQKLKPKFWLRVVDRRYTWLGNDINSKGGVSSKAEYVRAYSDEAIQEKERDGELIYIKRKQFVLGPFHGIVFDKMDDKSKQHRADRKSNLNNVIANLADKIGRGIRDDGEVVPMLIGVGFSGVGKTSTLISTNTTEADGKKQSVDGVITKLLRQKYKVADADTLSLDVYELYHQNKDGTEAFTSAKLGSCTIERKRADGTDGKNTIHVNIPKHQKYQMEIDDKLKDDFPYMRMALKFENKKLTEIVDVYEMILGLKRTRPTGNNSESSRSFLIIRIEIKGNDGRPPRYLMICDMPGQETSASVPLSVISAFESSHTVIEPSMEGGAPSSYKFQLHEFVKKLLPDGKQVQTHILTLVDELLFDESMSEVKDQMKKFETFQECLVESETLSILHRYPYLQLERDEFLVHGKKLSDDHLLKIRRACDPKHDNTPIGIMEHVVKLSSGVDRMCLNATPKKK